MRGATTCLFPINLNGFRNGHDFFSQAKYIGLVVFIPSNKIFLAPKAARLFRLLIVDEKVRFEAETLSNDKETISIRIKATIFI